MTLSQSCRQEDQKRAAAARAVTEVEDGLVLGLGSGSTAAFVVKALAARIADGLRVVAIPSSRTRADLARQLRVPLTSFAEHRRIDVTIDGAAQVERGTLNLVKGLGGALLREKILASASDRMIVVVDETKLVDRLGRIRRSPSKLSLSGGKPYSMACRRSAANRDCAWPETNLSRRTAAIASSIAPSPRYRTQRRWKPVFLPSSALLRAVFLSTWHPRSSSVGRLASR
jgi:hypothetical protein